MSGLNHNQNHYAHGHNSTRVMAPPGGHSSLSLGGYGGGGKPFGTSERKNLVAGRVASSYLPGSDKALLPPPRKMLQITGGGGDEIDRLMKKVNLTIPGLENHYGSNSNKQPMASRREVEVDEEDGEEEAAYQYMLAKQKQQQMKLQQQQQRYEEDEEDERYLPTSTASTAAASMPAPITSRSKGPLSAQEYASFLHSQVAEKKRRELEEKQRGFHHFRSSFEQQQQQQPASSTSSSRASSAAASYTSNFSKQQSNQRVPQTARATSSWLNGWN